MFQLGKHIIDSREARIICAAYIQATENSIKDIQLYPRLDRLRDVVLLVLLDKIFVTSKAVLLLVEGGMGADAFGLSRTAIETGIAIRYIENKDSEARARRYLEYFGKDRENLTKIVEKHHSTSDGTYSPDHLTMLGYAKQFKSPHTWFDKTLRDAAYEPSTWQVDSSGDPEHWEYTYDVVYKFTSHVVHATCVGVDATIRKFYVSSNYPGAFEFSQHDYSRLGVNALFNVCLHLNGAIEQIFHCFEMQVPFSIREAYAKFDAAFKLT